MSFGSELKRERELRQITLREVAEATKISLRHLEALERDDFGELPGGVFNRGFVRAYAQFIGVDPESMVNAYLMEEQDQASAAEEHERPKRVRPRRSDPETAPKSESWPPVVRWGLVVLAVVVLAAGIYFAMRISGWTGAKERSHRGVDAESRLAMTGVATSGVATRGLS